MAIARDGQPHKSQARGMLAVPNEVNRLHRRDPATDGSTGVRLFIKAAPPMAVMAALARAFPFLPRGSRGWAAAGTLMVGAAAAMVGIARLFS